MIASVVTLGCKVNEYESQSVLNQLQRAGYQVKEGLVFADVYVLNSCAVTNIAERKSRQYISKILKINPDAKIVVMGCASQNNPAQFLKWNNVVALTGNFGKNDIVSLLNNQAKQPQPMQTEYANFSRPIQTRARQYIKIQDGCNYFCTYCLIPYVRGRSRSRDIADIVDEIKNTPANEIVLTGINMSDYRQNDKLALTDLIVEVDKLNKRFRLSSLECNVLDDKLLDVLSNSKNFCPHFHLSLQSACNETLKRMNRHYTIEEFISIVKKIRQKFLNPTISTDIIVGFKGETDDEFYDTIANLKKIKFDFMHIFPYSERAGTVASKLAGAVDKKIVAEREKQIQALNAQFKSAFYKRNENKTQTMLVEEVDGNLSLGYTDNYIYAYCPNKLEVGKIYTIKLTKRHKDGMLCELIK